MISLSFKGVFPGDAASLGPAPWFRIAGNFVRQGPGGDIVATLRQHSWDLGGDTHYVRWDCAQPAMVHFEDAQGGATEAQGPFASLAAHDGVLRADEQLLVAKFYEETQLWHMFKTETYWPAVVINPAPGE